MKPISIEDIFGNPDVTQIRISPDKTRYACLADRDGVLNISVRSFDRAISEFITDETVNIWSFRWIDDQRILYLMDDGGDLRHKLYGVNTDGTGRTGLTPFDGVTVSVLGNHPEKSSTVLISMNKRDIARPDVYEVDIYKGIPQMYLENPGDFSRWLSGQEGVFGGIFVRESKKGIAVYQNGVFRDIFETRVTDELKVLRTGDPIYMITDAGADFSRLVSLSMDGGTLNEIHSRDGLDTDGVIWTEGGLPGGVVYEPDGQEIDFLDGELQKKHLTIAECFPGSRIDFRSRTARWELYFVHSDKDPGRWIIWHTDTQSTELLAVERISISPEDTYPMEFFMADGIPCYLTFPEGKRRNLPLMVQPHGGPDSRDYKEFKERAQFFASRGYLVLHINFRCSTGYGKAHREGGYKNWGSLAQDDIFRSTKWVIDNGFANPERVGILGTSFGGFSALWQVIQHPDIFKYAVAICPVTDLPAASKQLRPEEGLLHEKYRIEMGDPDTEADLLWRESPMSRWQEINCPVFLAHAENDTIVLLEQTIELHNRIQDLVMNELYIMKKGGHLLSNAGERLEMYRRIEGFLVSM